MKTSHPLLSFLTALTFAGTLAILALSFSLENAQYICAFFVVLIAVWIWVGLTKNAIWRMALVLSLSATLTVGRVLLVIFPENMLLLLIPLLGGLWLLTFLVLWFSLGSVVEIFWVFSLAARVETEQLETWCSLLYSRAPLSGWWVRSTIVEKLQKDGSALAVTLLANTVSDPAADEVRSQAFRVLEKLTDKTGIDALCAVWAANRYPALAGLITQNKWRASEPPEVLILSALLVGETDFLHKCQADLVPPLAQTAQDVDKLIAERATKTLKNLENIEAQEALCREIVERENAPAQEAALSTGYLPRETQQRALYLFITRQWERYDSLDFDRRLMRLAYLASPEAVRQRVRESLRATGRIDFLSIIAGDGSGERAVQLTSGESEVLAQTLISNHDWAALWKQVFDLPFHWSVRAVSTLVQSGWKPANGEEIPVFDELSALAGGLLMEPAEARELFPLAVLQATARVPGRINAVSFAPSHPGLAIGTGQGKVVIWNYQTAKRERVLRNFAHSVGEVVFCPDGTLLCAERTNGPETCSIYAFADVWNDDTSFSLGTHTGSVTALASVGAAQALSAGSDNNLVLWDIAARKEINRRPLADWARNLHVSPDGTQVLLLRKGLDLLSLPDLRDIAKAGKNAVFRSAAFAPDGTSMFAGTYAGQLFVYRKNPKRSDLLTAGKEPLADYPPSERLEATETLKRLSLLVVAASGGEIHFFSLDGNTPLGSVTVPGGQVTSLNVSPDEAFMAVGSASASLTLWDLRSMDLRLLLERPFAQAEVTTMPTLTAMLEHANLPARAHQVLQFAQAVLRQRFRFSIELGEAPSIATGEFDIEIEIEGNDE